MEQLFLIIHVCVALSLIAFVLMQKSEGGGIGFGGSSGSMTGMMSSRSKATFITKITTYLAAAFIITSLTLAVLASRTSDHSISLIDKMVEQEETKEPTTPSVPVAK